MATAVAVKITKIQQQLKRPDRVSVYVDGKYTFSLAKDQLVELGLKVGQEIDTQRINQYLSDSAFGKLRDQVYNWLSIRLRSRWEIEDYLKRKTDDELLTQRVITLLEAQKHIDDSRFAAAWIRHKTLIKPMSRLRLKHELLQKRIPLETIEDKLSDERLDDTAAIRQLIARRGHRYPDKQKLMAFLARQGFDYGTIKAALAEEPEEI